MATSPSANQPALLPRRMNNPVVVGPQLLGLDPIAPALRLPVEAHRGDLTLQLPTESGQTYAGLHWWQNGRELPGQDRPTLQLGELTLDESDVYYATWEPHEGASAGRSQSALVAVYPGHHLANQSARGFVSPAHGLTVSFVVGRSAGPVRAKRYLIRVIGPSLAKFGVEAPLAEPQIAFARRTNDCRALLQTDPALAAACSQAVGAFALDPAAGDFVAVADLPPGAYNVTVTALAEANGGDVLVEIYETRA
ncbi:hypothetical protein [Actomonas aquatica]|uniref:Uncharacterized protein n=1 Tax=Actomonas aquatica TaxID=2866162 RepID=A0ABZ1CA18_9BACT|nr:hypothetical protein [Opitutus sp. WL0086]WRQ88321.1 hypothetical protein K1X11_002820 [Opitutus sp. WL0086]